MVPAHIFQFHRARDLQTSLAALPNRPGTYLVLIRGGDRLLELGGYFDFHDRLPYQRAGFWHLYTGAGFEWGRRVRHHLAGHGGNSNLRRTLDALEVVHGAISRSGVAYWSNDDEHRLTRWLLRNSIIGTCECRDPKMLEKVILQSTPSPLNIDQRKWDGFGRRLMEIREQVQRIDLKKG